MFGYSIPRQQNEVNYDEESKLDFLSKYNMWDDYNKEIYQSSFTEPNNTYWKQYYEHSWDHYYSQDIIADYKKQIQRQITQMQSDINKVDLIECVVKESHNDVLNATTPKELSKDIFIVHGHNEEMKQTVARVVDQLGLNPIILHEQPNGGKTLIEKFEKNANNNNFAIILLSADDLAASIIDLKVVEDKDIRSKLEKRTRQNVVFEMGYLAGKLGRANLIFLIQSGVAKPGDLDGLVYTPYDDLGAWKMKLVKELKGAGYKVSADALV